MRTEELSPALQRLIFEEFFKFQLVLLMDRAGIKQSGYLTNKKWLSRKSVRQKLPDRPTQAQERSIAEVLADLQKPQAMNRILQGDVGAGKNISRTNGGGGSRGERLANRDLAPTEILAEQHFQQAQKILAPAGISIGFLSWSLKLGAEKIAAQEKIKSGEWEIVIGTHALIQEAVEWQQLALANSTNIDSE